MRSYNAAGRTAYAEARQPTLKPIFEIFDKDIPSSRSL